MAGHHLYSCQGAQDDQGRLGSLRDALILYLNPDGVRVRARRARSRHPPIRSDLSYLCVTRPAGKAGPNNQALAADGYSREPCRFPRFQPYHLLAENYSLKLVSLLHNRLEHRYGCRRPQDNRRFNACRRHRDLNQVRIDPWLKSSPEQSLVIQISSLRVLQRPGGLDSLIQITATVQY